MEVLKISIRCKHDKRDELLRVCRAVSEQASQVNGCQNSLISDSSANGELIILTQQWESWSDLSMYFSSDHFRALLGAMKLLGQSYEININGIPREDPGQPLVKTSA